MSHADVFLGCAAIATFTALSAESTGGSFMTPI
jgi:hypothetical protein